MFIVIYVVLCSCGAFVLAANIEGMLAKWDILKEEYTWTFIICLTIVLTLIVLLIIHMGTKKIRIKSWLRRNYPTIILSYCLLNMCLFAIQKKTVLSLASLKSLIGIEWTILAISCGIFIVWITLMKRQIESIKLRDKPNDSVVNRFNNLVDKSTLSGELKAQFLVVYYLVANVFVLAIITAEMYFAYEEIPNVIQVGTTVGFFLCTNTLVMLLMSIIQPIQKMKKDVLNQLGIPKTEFDWYKKLPKNIEILEILIDETGKRTELSEEEKLDIVDKAFNDLFMNNK